MEDDAVGIGLPEMMPTASARWLVETATLCWRLQYGVSVGALPHDLEVMKQLYDPIAQGRRLRQALEVKETPVPEPALPAAWWLTTREGSGLLTPEGRAGLAVVTATLSGAEGDEVRFLPEEIAVTERCLLAVYRSWTRQRLGRVIELRNKEGGQLHIAGVAVVLLLLLNRSTSSDRAMEQPVDPTKRAKVDAAVIAPLRAFIERLDPTAKVSDDSLSLYRGWAATEARRRLTRELILNAGRIWIGEDDRDEVIEFLGSQLGGRVDLTPESTAAAFDAMVDSYRMHRGALDMSRLAHERPSDTDRLRQNILAAMDASRRR
ncbi:MAG TPA: hypothetical protein VM142_02175 [Acidimicrobiales bacterium]|nr:hypothetical protein [Acidimicrobiales bacterium]